MLLGLVLFGMMLLPGVCGGRIDVSTQAKLRVIKCYSYNITKLSAVDTSPVTIKTCAPGEGCSYLNTHDTETATCEQLPRDIADKISAGGVEKLGGSAAQYAFKCITNMCNTKENTDYKKLEEASKLMDKTVEVLEEEAEKQGNETLYCNNADKERGTGCNTYCRLFRFVEKSGEVNRETSCVSRYDIIKNPKKIGAMFKYVRDDGVVMDAACRHNHCTEEGSILDKLFDEVKKTLDKKDSIVQKIWKLLKNIWNYLI